jgi:predicted small secreted protein
MSLQAKADMIVLSVDSTCCRLPRKGIAMNVFSIRYAHCGTMRRLIFALALSSIVGLAACDGSKGFGVSDGVAPLKRIGNAGTAIVDEQVSVSEGQVVYVPAYSHVYHKAGGKFDLAITLSIRNTSGTDEIFIRSVRYHDSAGKLVKTYSEGSLRLAPLATTEFFVPEQDTSGGSGANFIVEWVAEKKEVTTPIIEAVMITTSGQQGISFVRSGQVIQVLPHQ